MSTVKALPSDTLKSVDERYMKGGFGKVDSQLALARYITYKKALTTGNPQRRATGIDMLVSDWSQDEVTSKATNRGSGGSNNE